MGIPKFYRYISERYPCLPLVFKEFQIADFDNLYLDMNGIIHACSHPNDFNPHIIITEEKIFSSIFHYVEVLFRMIKPKKILFIAVDGVAPRAKLNHQRARRFRAAKESEMAAKKLASQGEIISLKEKFDSNCITPGTLFMDRLHMQLKYFVINKISTDPLWQKCKVILSGHQTPGEGEHKILDYIRYLKTQPGYDPNTKHCLYGMDADLIILGLCTHEPHFSLLREKVQYGHKQSKKITSPDETEFYLFHLSLLREYLDLEFQELKAVLPFEYSLENIIDDWVLMGFFVGNDFIPHLPNLHINKGSLSILYKTYKEILPTLDGYINENGYLNFPRFQTYIKRLADHDLETFEETYADLAFLEEKGVENSFGVNKANNEVCAKSELEELIKATSDMFFDSEEECFENDDGDTFLSEFNLHKKNYYSNKLEYGNVTEEVVQSLAEEYVRAIQWNLHYYYQGCQSWSWYYPYNYSPYISDITDCKNLKLNFEMGNPFLPFEQLLAVLPPASKNLVPEAYQHLMTSSDSPIKCFYPENFETDMNEKQQEWEAIVLIPFIDEEKLLKAMEPFKDKLTLDEIRRNRHGPMTVYTYTTDDLGVYKAPQYFPSVGRNHALAKDVWKETFSAEKSKLKYGLLPGVSLDVYHPGFPTLKYIPFSASLKSKKVKVFDQASRGDNMVLAVLRREFPSLPQLAKSFLGKVVYVNWPHLVEAKVVAVADTDFRYSLTDDGQIEIDEMNAGSRLQWRGEGNAITEHYSSRLGIEIGEPTVIVYVVILESWKYMFEPGKKPAIEKTWSSVLTPTALQTVVKDIVVAERSVREHMDFCEAFPVDSTVFMLGQPHFGCLGRILDNSDCGRLKVALEIVSDPSVEDDVIFSSPKISYLPCRVAALKIGICPLLLSRITGDILIDMSPDGQSMVSGSKVNIGLKLKFNKKNEELPGYTKKENEVWFYSMKVVNLVSEYVKKFSDVVEFLSENLKNSCFPMQKLFPGPDGLTRMKEVLEWLKGQEHNTVCRVKCGSELLDGENVSALEKIVDAFSGARVTRTIQVKPHLLYKSDLVYGNFAPVKGAKHKLLDRVVAVRASHTVPVGLRGFIIGIHKEPMEADWMYDVVFDKSFVGGMTINSSPERAFRMSRASFVNLSDAKRTSLAKLMPGIQADTNTLLKPVGSEPKASAFVQWSHQPPRPLLVDSDDHFKRIWSDLQSSKPQEETNALKKILKIGEKEKSSIEDPVKIFFEKVSTSSSNLVPSKIDDEKKTEIPEKVGNLERRKNKYYIQLFSYYQKKKLGQPRFKYIHVGSKVMAQVFIGDGQIYSGLPCDDKNSACESACLQVLGALGEVALNKEILIQEKKERKIMENQTKLTKALVKDHCDGTRGGNEEKKVEQNHPLESDIPHRLPDPPSQWVSASKHSKPDCSRPKQRRDCADESQGSSANCSHILSTSALAFVPLQAITGKRNFGNIATVRGSSCASTFKRSTDVNESNEKNNKINQLGRSSTGTKPKRKPKIAANLALDPNLY